MEHTTYDFGLIGLGVMGRNFILNVADNNFTAFGHDLDPEKVNALKEEGKHTGRVDASTDVHAFVNALSKPRKIMLLVPAGKIVDSVIEELAPLLDKGDLIIDGGNSFFTDTDRREAQLQSKGIHFFGAGVSGGAEGARRGPSIMPGGNKEAYKEVKPIFEAVAAKFKGEPCVAYLGPKSAGNYVKMVHNGIEYGLMQLTSEIYDVLKKAGNFDNKELHNTFSKWNEGRLQSFLVEITSKIFTQKDDKGSGFLIDKILDKAKLYSRPKPEPMEKEKLEKITEEALYFSFITTYAQGLHQLADASQEYGYELDLSIIAKIWRAGCIIRAALLEDITQAYKKDGQLHNLLLASAFVEKINSTVGSARELVAYAAKNGIPVPGLAASLTYFDAYTSSNLPLNLIQAQRDYFGSHTYERTDMKGIFHTEWD